MDVARGYQVPAFATVADVYRGYSVPSLMEYGFMPIGFSDEPGFLPKTEEDSDESPDALE